MVFPVVMYGCESWTVKKAERQRIDAFELWCWRRLLRIPWTARSSNQSIIKEISPGCSLEGLMLKLKLQYFGHLMWRVDSLEKTDAGRDWGQEEKGTREDEMAGWHHWLDGCESGWTPGVGDGQGGLVCCDSWGHKELDMTEWLNWTELNWYSMRYLSKSIFFHMIFLLSQHRLLKSPSSTYWFEIVFGYYMEFSYISGSISRLSIQSLFCLYIYIHIAQSSTYWCFIICFNSNMDSPI